MSVSSNPIGPSVIRASRLTMAMAAAVWLASCLPVPPPGIGKAITWDQLPGWRDEHPAQAWPALLENCKVLAPRDARWSDICTDAALLTDPDDVTARAFFETRFTPHVMVAEDGANEGLMTGYYEPLLHGSRQRSERYRYPIYARPDDLLVVDLGDVYPELKGKRLRGRIDGRRVVPYRSRVQIEHGSEDGKGLPAQPIVWVDDPVDLYFLHVQGSGRVQLPDGKTLFLGYADQNGYPYRSLGRQLVDLGAMKLEDVSMQTIRAWLQAHPDQLTAMLDNNPSYVFFEERADNLPGPVGALRVPLLPERAIAVDPTYVPLGTPVWLDTTLPNEPAVPYRRLVFAQDTGGAIRGPVRADLFFGFGERAEELAGEMKQAGKMYALLPTLRVSQK